ncbi:MULTISPECIES: TetR/AcrR family transcriptional regulator [unclassified Bradyrhizobium]|uniref:TetR/AcrR family transcriptional regulator n=1 Tax=unclassified Bradyrhizobium TaxID=2631580 RepID=UPI001BA8F37E|nr:MULTISPECIES: TetR/AcrR family transcriptional regulator [unclassified Bradyrhizobium]MBR1223975.1 TetR/AcrR family transcriptional regulator [Bradyrhizobium sp. AUGA SZCCT0176]MBR1283323.1 TetR/AcrR family transcriptional regulator [Bradyrhizobium sp. AUGA SZCCT0177]MBR1298403.1 TetR/AcrR family transcriptional regulator [Bradyrhizobium sp. AUGA SZCCT0042]
MNPYGAAKDAILAAGLRTFDKVGFDQATVMSVCELAGASNGSFFHFFGSKRGLAAELFLRALRSYHAAMLAPLSQDPDAATGVAELVAAHLRWVVESRREANFLFEQSRAEWLTEIRKDQQEVNSAFRAGMARWFDPHVASGAIRGMPISIFTSQIIGPAQIHCRAWLSGRERSDPREHTAFLAECAIRSVVNLES